MTTVQWRFKVKESNQPGQYEIDSPEIVGGTLPEADRKRLWQMIYESAYGMDDFYLLGYLEGVGVVTKKTDITQPFTLTIEMAEDWDVPKGTPDELIRVEQNGNLVWLAEVPAKEETR